MAKENPILLKTYSNAKCPKCKFPQTTFIWNLMMTKVLYEHCNSYACDWARKVEGVTALPIKLKKKKNAKEHNKKRA